MKPDPFAQLALDAAGLQVAVELLRRYSNAGEPTTVPALTGWQLRRAIEFLQDHLAAPIQLADVAAAVGLSPYHFCRAFGAAVGVPPQQYLRALRMRRAQQMLAGGITVSSAAARLGYRNVAAFARAFKREIGHSPRNAAAR
jgi:AraC family transcriptional regulator